MLRPAFRPIPRQTRAALVRLLSDEVGGTVRLPGSKSLTNRALLLAGIARGASRVENVLDCDDSRYMLAALEQLGLSVVIRDAERVAGALTVEIEGDGGPYPARRGEFHLGNAGTTTRFLTGTLSASGGQYVVDGSERMRERPIDDLVRALASLGADIRAPSGCPPVSIGPGRLRGGDVRMSGRVSSQFISSVLMASTLADAPVSLRISGDLVSRPYVDLTLDALEAFGCEVETRQDRYDGAPIYRVRSEAPRGSSYFVEGDASTASYFFAVAAITHATVRVEGVGRATHQGDVRCADVLAEMGCRVTKEEDAITVTGGPLHGVDCDGGDFPDVMPTLAVVAAFARGRTRLRGVAHLRHKESDRIAAVVGELARLGVDARELADGLEVRGVQGLRRDPLHGAEIRTWGDHRIAMAFSIAALAVPEVRILDPEVVTKSFPGFFHALASLGADISFVGHDGRETAVEVPGGSR